MLIDKMATGDLVLLVVDAGARGHALYRMLRKSKLVKRVLCLPGNAGIPDEDRRAGSPTDIEAILRLAHDEGVDFVVAGTEDPLALGLVDRLEAQGIAAFGPTQAAAQLESSKSFCMDVCTAAGIPTPPHLSHVTTMEMVEQALEQLGPRLAVKADGLFRGQGVKLVKSAVAVRSVARRMLSGEECGQSGKKLVLQQLVSGKEMSVMFLCDGGDAKLFGCAVRDHKHARDDTEDSPMTGGMGAYSLNREIGFGVTDQLCGEYVLPILKYMARRGTPFRGVMFLGLMVTEEGKILVLEINVRFGDPELPLLSLLIKNEDIVLHLLSTRISGGLAGLPPLSLWGGVAVYRVLAARGYPGEYLRGQIIRHVDLAARHADVFHAGTERDVQGEYVKAGGRVLGIGKLGPDFETAGRAVNCATQVVVCSDPHGVDGLWWRWKTWPGAKVLWQ